MKRMKPQSIDYGILEHAERLFTIPVNFGWDDVGSWMFLRRFQTADPFGNIVDGYVMTVNTRNSIIEGQKRLIAAVGVENLIIIDTDDVLLVCAEESVKDIKKVLENLRMRDKDEYF